MLQEAKIFLRIEKDGQCQEAENNMRRAHCRLGFTGAFVRKLLLYQLSVAKNRSIHILVKCDKSK